MKMAITDKAKKDEVTEQEDKFLKEAEAISESIKKAVKDEESEYKKRAEKAELPYIEMQVHYLNQQNMFGDGGSIPKNVIQQFVQPLRDKGYELINTHYIGTNEEGIGFAFVFVLK